MPGEGIASGPQFRLGRGNYEVLSALAVADTVPVWEGGPVFMIGNLIELRVGDQTGQ